MVYRLKEHRNGNYIVNCFDRELGRADNDDGVRVAIPARNKIRTANEAQLEAQIAPAIVFRVEPAGEVQLLNLGTGPALHLRLSAAGRGSVEQSGLDRLTGEIDFV